MADGLDTVATITLNGRRVAQTENMFVGFRWHVKPLLRRGRNELLVRFGSAMDYIRTHRTGTHPARDQRSRRRLHAHPQGTMPVRLGLGTALRHGRHLAATSAWKVGPATGSRACAWRSGTMSRSERLYATKIGRRFRIGASSPSYGAEA